MCYSGVVLFYYDSLFSMVVCFVLFVLLEVRHLKVGSSFLKQDKKQMGICHCFESISIYFNRLLSLLLFSTWNEGRNNGSTEQKKKTVAGIDNAHTRSNESMTSKLNWMTCLRNIYRIAPVKENGPCQGTEYTTFWMYSCVSFIITYEDLHHWFSAISSHFHNINVWRRKKQWVKHCRLGIETSVSTIVASY